MKKTLLFLLITTLSIFAQNKILIRNSTFNGSIRNFAYADNVLYLAAYDFGIRSIVYKSTDQGQNWNRINLLPFPAEDNLNAIFFISASTGWVGSYANGKIYKTTNGGISWTPATTNFSQVSEIKFFDVNNGFACGSSATSGLIKTTDGGATWNTVTLPVTNSMNGMHWDNPTNGWVVGNSGYILKTTDGGANWVSSQVGTTANQRIQRVDANTFYIVGGSSAATKIAKSTDNGVTFTALAAPAAGILYTLDFASASSGLVLGSQGAAYRTTDGGASWILIPPFTTEVLKASIKIGSKILIGGYESTLFSTTDIGLTFTKLAENQRDIYGIFSDAPGNYVLAMDRGGVEYTSNSGLTWNRTNFSSGTLYYDIYKSGNYLYVTGQQGSYNVSSDLGNTWTSYPNGGTSTRNYKMQFLTPTNGYMVSNDGTIKYTTNRGVNWTIQATFPGSILYDIKMLNATTGYAIGGGDNFFKTTDGVNWFHTGLDTSFEQIAGISMLNENIGYACGQNGVIFKTTNGWQTKQLISDTAGMYGIVLHDILAFNESTVYAVGTKGVIMKTITPDLMKVVDTTFFGEDLLTMLKVSDSVFVAGGEWGSLYRFSNKNIPVELTSFTAQGSENNVVLNWSTATELNNKGFSVERRKSGDSWKSIAFVNGKGTTIERNFYSYKDAGLESGKYSYRLKQVDFDGTSTYSSEVETEVNVIYQFALNQNYPNPFNPSTRIKFSIPGIQGNNSMVTLKIYNILGKEAAVLVNREMSAGEYEVDFNPAAFGLSSGVYVFKLSAGEFINAKKMIFLK